MNKTLLETLMNKLELQAHNTHEDLLNMSDDNEDRGYLTGKLIAYIEVMDFIKNSKEA